MGEREVTTVRGLIDSWNRGDVDAILANLSDDFESVPQLVVDIGGGPFRGHDGAVRFFEEWESTWETFEIRLDELRDFGDQVVALCQVHAKGRGSGIELDQPLAQLFRFRGGKVVRGQTFLDPDRGLAAGGAEGEGGG